jgi:hypothetical protein
MSLQHKAAKSLQQKATKSLQPNLDTHAHTQQHKATKSLQRQLLQWRVCIRNEKRYESLPSAAAETHTHYTTIHHKSDKSLSLELPLPQGSGNSPDHKSDRQTVSDGHMF